MSGLYSMPIEVAPSLPAAIAILPSPAPKS